ncbi:hypothetical protein KDX05_23685 [Burkholderia vietnamiensis]|uniref:hypothetical protein n=1 Tax=Burkholderia vietnamiensis TaxID=60552 RepID=UPI001BA0AB53|nr:hypothetical protein [Burkholderia vietnamiensis]MBR8192709.1 hypothetical protein [Burkholderia vietnamiensis]MBR8231311.1 hypothetical protein [Burkholderia vietnamiensis]MCA7946596.1 hypothetical protein [Burkholderia vietnamiensis]HDR9146461.1 hypothetical protein [Burkholderia vietnamiensis]
MIVSLSATPRLLSAKGRAVIAAANSSSLRYSRASELTDAIGEFLCAITFLFVCEKSVAAFT